MFLAEPPSTEASSEAYARDIADHGYVMNLSRLWCWRPDLFAAMVETRSMLAALSTLTDRERAVLVTATAATLGDSYCSLAWGARLAAMSDGATAAQMISGDSAPDLTQRESALADWARRVTHDPNATTAADVDSLRAAGLDDREIFEATTFIALRMAFATVNDALGVAPDQQMLEAAPPEVRDVVSFGRATATTPSAVTAG